MNYSKKLLAFAAVACLMGYSFAAVTEDIKEGITEQMLAESLDPLVVPDVKAAVDVAKDVNEDVKAVIEESKDIEVTKGEIEVESKKTEEVSVEKKFRRELKNMRNSLGVMADAVGGLHKEGKDYSAVVKALLTARNGVISAIELLKQEKLDIAVIFEEIRTVPEKGGVAEVVAVQPTVPEEVKVEENVKSEEGLERVTAGERVDVIADQPIAVAVAAVVAEPEVSIVEKKEVEKAVEPIKKSKKGRMQKPTKVRTGKGGASKRKVSSLPDSRAVRKSPMQKGSKVR